LISLSHIYLSLSHLRQADVCDVRVRERGEGGGGRGRGDLTGHVIHADLDVAFVLKPVRVRAPPPPHLV